MEKFTDKYELLPIGNQVILERKLADEKSKGGLYLPQTAQEKSLQATVIATGPGLMTSAGVFVETTVKPGDVVLVDKIGGFELDLNGEKVLVVREPEIIAIIKRK